MEKSFLGTIYSDNGMKIINLVFLFSFLIRNGIFSITACSLWLIYLLFGIKLNKSRAMKIFLSMLSLYAIVIIAANIYFLLR